MKISEHMKMSNYLRKFITLAAIVVIFAAVGITAFHHHALNTHEGQDCEICNFINILNTAVLPLILTLWRVAVFIAVVFISNNSITSKKEKQHTSRAPPLFIL